MLRRLLPFALLAALAQPALAAAPHETGVVRTADGDIGYETFGDRNAAALPIIAVNGGPGLTHAYMLRNDMWAKVAQRRFVVFYDQRGLGASKHFKPGASQGMDAQVAD